MTRTGRSWTISSSAADAAHKPRNELAHTFVTISDDGDPGKPWQRLDLRAMEQTMRPVTISNLKSVEDSGLYRMTCARGHETVTVSRR